MSEENKQLKWYNDPEIFNRLLVALCFFFTLTIILNFLLGLWYGWLIALAVSALLFRSKELAEGITDGKHGMGNTMMYAFFSGFIMFAAIDYSAITQSFNAIFGPTAEEREITNRSETDNLATLVKGKQVIQAYRLLPKVATMSFINGENHTYRQAVVEKANKLLATKKAKRVIKANKLAEERSKYRFQARDLIWQDEVLPYKEIALRGINKVAKENYRCREIEKSVFLSMSKGTKKNPVFFVTCGSGAKIHNYFFSKTDVESDIKLEAKRHMNKGQATLKCENYAKSQAVNPSTVDFSRFIGLSVYQTPNGRTRISSNFTAKSAVGQKLRYDITCLMDASGFFEGNIYKR